VDDFHTTDRSESELVRFLRAIRDHWVMIAVIVVAAVAAAAAYAETTAKRYKATADILVTPVSPSDTTFVGIDVLRESSDQSRAVLTVARLVESPQNAAVARRRLRVKTSPDALLQKISVNPLGQSQIVTVTATDSKPRAAAALANAFANGLVTTRTATFQADVRTQIKRLRTSLNAIPVSLRNSAEAVAIQQRLGDVSSLLGAPDPSIQLAVAAVSPQSPSWPRPKLTMAVAFVAALLFGSALALALDFFNPRLRREEELLFEHRLPILTRVPRMNSRVVHGYLGGKEPLPPSAWEAYRRLRASLTEVGPDGTFPKTILITSAAPGEGKTMTSVNLALTLVSAEMRVVLVDGDLRHPMVASIFGVAPRRHSLGSALLDTVSPDDVLISAPEHPSLRLLLARPESAEFVDLLTPRRVSALLEKLHRKADVVIIDSPPVGEAADALAFAAAADAVLVAVRLGATQRTRLADLRRIFAQRGITATGVVLTTDRRQPLSHYYYGTEHDIRPRLRGEQVRKGRAEAQSPTAGEPGATPEVGQRAWPPRAPAQR
jgi:capsular exopolysaccharide synthesis family protein